MKVWLYQFNKKIHKTTSIVSVKSGVFKIDPGCPEHDDVFDSTFISFTHLVSQV